MGVLTVVLSALDMHTWFKRHMLAAERSLSYFEHEHISLATLKIFQHIKCCQLFL